MDFAFKSDGVSIESKRAIIAITTSNSTKLNACRSSLVVRRSTIVTKDKLNIKIQKSKLWNPALPAVGGFDPVQDFALLQVLDDFLNFAL
jgi:hypothetical protein